MDAQLISTQQAMTNLEPIRFDAPYGRTVAFACTCGRSGPGSPAQRTNDGRPVPRRLIRLSVKSPASHWIAFGGGLSPLLIPHSTELPAVVE